MLFEDVPLSLALFDMVPNILFLLGIWQLAQCPCFKANKKYRNLWIMGGIGTLLGGLAKVIWKTILSITGINLSALSDQLFVTQSISFSLMLISIIFYLRCMRSHFNKDYEKATTPTTFNIAIILMVAWKLPFFFLMILTTISTYFLLIIAGIRMKNYLSAGLWALALIIMLGMSQLAQTDLSVNIQWIAELTNSLGQGAFFGASWIYVRKNKMKMSDSSISIANS